MGTKKDPATSNDTDSDITPENDVAGKLRLNKQTLQDLGATDEHADKVRGGAPNSTRCNGNGCTKQDSGCN